MRTLLLMPSFWGGITWTAWLILYQMRLIQWEEPGIEVLLLYWIVAVTFWVSTLLLYPLYRTVIVRFDEMRLRVPVRRRSKLDLYGLLTSLLHLFGFVGLGLYLAGIAASLGGLPGLVGLITNPGQSYLIRQLNLDQDYVGLELTYLGWAAIFLTVIGVSNRWISRKWYLISAAQFAGNMLLVDRTRPVWIAFVVVVLLLLMNHKITSFQLIARFALLLTGVVAFFVAYAIWSGRIQYGNPYGDTPLPPWAQSIYVYGTSGFAYFNRLVADGAGELGVPVRIIAPLGKISAALGLTPPPPAEVLEFFYMPFATNVGSFLEPFYQDGGILLLALGILLYSVGFNFLGAALISHGKPFSLILWANICFATFIGFFVPKIGSTALWVFIILAIGGMLIPRKSTARPVPRKVTSGTTLTADTI